MRTGSSCSTTMPTSRSPICCGSGIGRRPNRWRSILDQFTQPTRTAVDEHSLKGDDLGLIQRGPRHTQGRCRQVDRPPRAQPSVLSGEPECSWRGSRPGLNFVHKRVPDRWRIMALIYAAANLGAYHRSCISIDWSKNGPEVRLPELNQSHGARPPRPGRIRSCQTSPRSPSWPSRT